MASAAQRKIKSISYARYGYYFIIPFFIVYCLFQIWPMVQTFMIAFYGNVAPNDGRVATIGATDEWYGLKNLTDLIVGNPSQEFSVAETNSNAFWDSMKNTCVLWIGNFIPQILLSLLLAVWFTDAKLKIPGKGFFKVVMYMPNILTAASVAMLFQTLLSDVTTIPGPINALFQDWGILKDGETIKFLTETSQDAALQRGVIMFIQTWMWFGNTMLMLMSGIMGINGSLFEAANIDGASSGQVFFRITLPLLRPIMLYTLVTSMIGGLQMFDVPLLYRSGPQLSTVNDNLKTVAIFIYSKFNDPDEVKRMWGFAGAASVILFVVTSALGGIAFYINRDKDAIAKKKQIKKLIKQQKQKPKQGLGAMGRI